MEGVGHGRSGIEGLAADIVAAGPGRKCGAGQWTRADVNLAYELHSRAGACVPDPDVFWPASTRSPGRIAMKRVDMNWMGLNRYAAWLAAAVWSSALLAFGVMVEGYSQALHPVALLGARGMPHALAFNLVGLLLPGLLAALAAYSVRHRLPVDADWSARIGAWMLLVSALAFAAQGLLPLDPSDLDAPGSRRHAVVWMLWWIAFVPAALLLAIGMRRVHGRRVFALASVMAAALVLGFAVLAPVALGVGLAQRIAFGVWFAWLVLASRQARASGPRVS